MGDTFNVNDINSFLKRATETISCGTECQKQKETDKLKQEYLNAQVNLDTAPGKLEIAEKNYVTYTQGTQAYNALANQQSTSQAQTDVSSFQANFNAETDTVYSEIQTFSKLENNLKYVYDLYYNLEKENDELYISFKDSSSDILTNERKTYYEDQGISNLSLWYYVLLVIYIIFAICFAILSVVYPSSFGWKYRLAICVCLIILPFISAYLLDLILVIFSYIYSYLPKNAHLTIEPPNNNEKNILEETKTLNW